MTTSLRLPFDGPPPPDPAARDAAARQASVDPARNVVLEASAGTGKTRVLVDRYLNLLEAGVDPSNILAITFTRKAAAEMRERIVQRLRRDATLSPAHAARWRTLRERLGEVNISTIDAFCLLLLREFPLEADVDPGFSVADDTDVMRAACEALDRLLPIARRLASSDDEVALVLAQLDDRRLRSGLASLLNRRLVVRRTFRRALAGVPAGLTLPGICRDTAERLRAAFARSDGGLEAFLAGGPCRHSRFALLAHDLRALAARFGENAGHPDPASLQATLDLVRGYFLTAAGKPRERLAADYALGEFTSAEAARRHARAVAAVAPDVAEVVNRYRRDVNAVVTRGLARLFRIASRLYVQRLEGRSVLDFTELLGRALGLLGRMDEFSQSRYRLESRYHHLLVDEFQDTSSPQWQLVSRLVRSWAEGAGLPYDRPLAPSIFVVGDRKQSIYGFRDADVTILRRARRFVERLRPEGRVRHTISRSFRSVPALQAFQNDLFAAVEAVAGRRDAFRFGARDRFPEDPACPPAPAATALTAAASGDSARAEVLDAIPLGVVAADEVAENADAVAEEIARLLSRGPVRGRSAGLPRPVLPADIAVLFRSRESHREYARALERRSIPSYVYKGLGFFDADEVKDVVALVRYLADPASELRAAAFLRSGFVRLSDPALQALAGRLSTALRTSDDAEDAPQAGFGPGHDPGAEGAGFSEQDRRVLAIARRAVIDWLRLADDLPPAALLDRILAESAYAWERRGPREAQARENLKKVRGLVRRIQNRGYATLARIAEHLEQLSAGDDANAIVDAVDAVNLMTVHAAKGLEFPVVFLVNVTRGSGGHRAPIRAAAASTSHRASAAAALVSVGDFLSEADHDLRAREREETKRLLYVAATRARDRLYFSATVAGGHIRPAPGSLAQVLPPSFTRFLAEACPGPEPRAITWASPRGIHHAFRVLPRAAARVSGCRVAGAPADEPIIDAFGPLAAVREPDRVTVTGSADSLAAETPGGITAAAGGRIDAISDDDVRKQDPEADRLLGILVHRLLAWSAGRRGNPDRSQLERRACTLASYLEGCDERLVDRAWAICQELAARPDVGGVLAEADLLFEVPFSFAAEAGRIVRGTIDCLARDANGQVTILEFKTGIARTEHEAQLATYLRAAAELFPGPPPRGLLVYSSRQGHVPPPSNSF